MSVRMLRYYEAEGLLAPRRTAAGYRVFDAADERTVARIRLLGAAGMTLETIRVFLPCVRGDGPVFEPCEELRQVLHDQIARIDDRTRELGESRAVLAGFLREIERGDAA